MPGENGLVLQQLLVHQSCAIPVIFITGNGDIPMAVLAMKRGAVDFLTKPFNAQELLDAFRGTELQRSTWIMRLYPYHVLPDTPWGSARAVGFDILTVYPRGDCEN